jgi:hypothetical protein
MVKMKNNIPREYEAERIGPLRIQVVPDKYRRDVRQRREENYLPLNRTYILPCDPEIIH